MIGAESAVAAAQFVLARQAGNFEGRGLLGEPALEFGQFGLGKFGVARKQRLDVVEAIVNGIRAVIMNCPGICPV